MQYRLFCPRQTLLQHKRYCTSTHVIMHTYSTLTHASYIHCPLTVHREQVAEEQEISKVLSIGEKCITSLHIACNLVSQMPKLNMKHSYHCIEISNFRKVLLDPVAVCTCVLCVRTNSTSELAKGV